MTEPLKLGQIINDYQKRDAIHIAVAPVVAVEELAPGQHVGFVLNNNAESVGKTRNPIGVVDPFLRHKVRPGERFWMFLYPNTITSLRHEWAHPAFDAREVFGKLEDSPSKKWLEDFAKKLDVNYDEMIQAAHTYITDKIQILDVEGMTSDGDWRGNETPEEFWGHFENVTGRKIDPDKRGDFFTCTC